MAALRPNWPTGLPSPQALQAATDALRRQYVVPETVLHPVIVRQALDLAYLLTAYSMVPAEAVPGVAADTVKTSSRAGAIRRRRHDVGLYALADTPSPL